MINLPQNNTKKALLIVGLVLVLMGAVYRFFPEAQWLTGNDTMAQKKLTLGKYRKIVAGEKKISTELAVAARIIGGAQRMIMQADTASVAAVDIQKRINEFAAENKVTLESMRFLEPKKVELEELKEYVTIPIQFSLDAPIRDITDLLYKIETSDKLLTVQEMRIRAKQGTDSRISATVIVYGYMLAKGDQSVAGSSK